MNTFQAEAISRIAHQGQKYGDRPYIEAHIIPVVDRVLQIGGGPDAAVVAWLHDVLEDNPGAAKAWQESPRITLTRDQALALHAITRCPGEEYPAYIERVCKEPIARLVKFCDLQVNLSNSSSMRPSLRPRYVMALERVRKELDNHLQLATCHMVRSTVAAAADIESYFLKAKTWHKRGMRAAMVLDWCEVNGWHFDAEVTEDRLAAGMDCMPYWNQGPANYFDLARALSAAALVPA